MQKVTHLSFVGENLYLASANQIKVLNISQKYFNSEWSSSTELDGEKIRSFNINSKLKILGVYLNKESF